MDVASDLAVLSAGSAAGNRFWLWDGFLAAPPADPAREAVRLCAEEDRDGLLLLLPGSGADADCRMVLHNADGSRAETCGNGLRLVGARMAEAGRLAGTRLRVRTDVGIRTVEVFPEPGRSGIRRARAELGPVRELRALELESSGELLHATFVDLGNPHCVVLGDAALLERLPELGPRLERHPSFPDRANVELVARHSMGANGLTARVWERGVGETAACGSGACAVAVAAREAGRVEWPVAVEMPGGSLTVGGDLCGVWLEGPVDEAV